MADAVDHAVAEAMVNRMLAAGIDLMPYAPATRIAKQVADIPDDPFEAAVAELRATAPECTDGGGEDHFASLVSMGNCPYCGLDAEDG